jgi:hypothetical protein
VSEAHGACWIDEDIATELRRIGMRGSRPPAAHQFLRVRPPRSGSPDVPQASSKHPVGAIQTPSLIDQDCPASAGLLDVGARERTRLERHDDDSGVEIAERPFVLLQLQQMPSARQSTEVAMKHQEHPMSLVVSEAMDATLCVEECERSGRPPNPMLVLGPSQSRVLQEHAKPPFTF